MEELVFELDGDIHPRTVNARDVLKFFLSYLEAMRKLAKKDGKVLEFTGIEVQDKCLQLKSLPNDPTLLHQEVVKFDQFLFQEEVPKFIASDVVAFRKGARQFEGMTALKVTVGDRPTISFTPSIVRREQAKFFEQNTVRAIVLRAGVANAKGGVKTVPVRLSIEDEDKERQFTTDVDTARQLGALLFREIEASVTVARNAKGDFVNGRLESFEVVSTEDVSATWRKFFAEVASEWNSLNIEKELERD